MNKETVVPRRPSGFAELLPEDQILFNVLRDIIRATYEKYGFVPIETPAIELVEVLLAKGGGDTEKQIYRFTKGKNDLALHYDLTVPLARYVAEHYAQLIFPLRRYQMQKVWRAERAQKGRYREFLQCDIDVIGDTDATVEAEMVAIIDEVFTQMDIGDFIVRVSNRKILTGILQSFGIKSHDIVLFIRIIDKMDKCTRSDIAAQLHEQGLTSEQSEKLLEMVSMQGNHNDIIAALEQLGVENDDFIKGVEELRDFVKAVADYGVRDGRYRIDLSIARGLDYYTGTIYETNLIAYPELGSIASGGRYDNLVGYYIDRELSGVGISIGLTRLFSKMKEKGLLNKNISKAKVLIAQLDRRYRRNCLHIAQILRRNGIAVEVYPTVAKLRKQLTYAHKAHIRHAIFIGEDEVAGNVISVKDMKTGEQVRMSVDEFTQKYWDE